MMSRAPRWPETLVDSKTNKPSQKKGAKERAASAAAVCSQAGGSASKTSVTYGRSNSLNRTHDSAASRSEAGGSLKRSISGNQATKPASRRSRSAIRLSSSRSFSSLNTSSLTAAPFMRSSRSLNRLDQRSTGEDSDTAVQKGQMRENKGSGFGQLCSSEQKSREKRDHGNNVDKLKTSSSEAPSSASLVSTAECVKKQTRDGVYTLCAMTSGMRRNWVHAVLKNVRPTLTSPVSGQTTRQKSQREDSQAAEVLNRDEDLNKFLQEHKARDCAEKTHHHPTEGEQKSANGSSAPPRQLSPSTSSVAPTISPVQQVEEGEASSCHYFAPIVADTRDDAPTSAGKAKSDRSGSATEQLRDECFDEPLDMQRQVEEQAEAVAQSEAQQVSVYMSHEDKEVKENGHLLVELEQTHSELSRLKRLNKNLQDELQKEKRVHVKTDLPNTSAEQTLALQRLQKVNHDLRLELEAQKRNQEEAREAELRQRVDLLAQQAQLLVTGDATALAQAHLEQDRRRFVELRGEWESHVASLKSQLSSSEERRKEAELHLAQLQQELHSLHSVQQEADRLQKQLREVTSQLHVYEEAQAQKDARLQNHIMLLQASQDRERRSLTASLAEADQRSQDLQERLDRAKEQVGKLNQTQTWAREIEMAQQQLQEELVRTVSAVERLQEEREELEHRCQELQNQLSEADGEVSRLQSRLKTDETHYYNLEHSYEKVCEELQLALGKVQQKESETQDMREGYEALLDRKEQELDEVLLKMEVLGNSLEETEVKLSEVLKVCTCTSSLLRDKSSEEILNERRRKGVQLLNSAEHLGSHVLDSTHQDILSAGDDPERFLSVIQLLETKLYVTEEKLRDFMQRLEEHQGDAACQDPHLCSQLTQSRATAQHLSLLLHSRAKQSRRFALATERRCIQLAGRFQVALNVVQDCRERLRAAPVNAADVERQLAAAAACLQQGEREAEEQRQESRNAGKGEEKILNDETLCAAEGDMSGESKLTSALNLENDTQSVAKCLVRELFVVEQLASFLQSQDGIGQLSLTSREVVDGDVAHRYKSIIAQRIALMTETRRAECGNSAPLNVAVSRVCAEAELIYAALKLQQQHESVARENTRETEHPRKGLADINPPELAPYDEQVQGAEGGEEGAAKPAEKGDVAKVEADKCPDWLERLLCRLQRRAKTLQQLIQEISDVGEEQCGLEDTWENATAVDLNLMLEEAKLIYLLDRLHSDLEQEWQQSDIFRDKLQARCKERGLVFREEQEALSCTLHRLQADNSALRSELECAGKKITSAETGKQRLLEDIEKIQHVHEKQMKKLEAEFQEKLRKLQQIHEEEMKQLHGYYTKSGVAEEKQTKSCAAALASSSGKGQTATDRKTQEELGYPAMEDQEADTKGTEEPKAPCYDGLSALEEMHRKLINDLQQQHQKEVAALLKEKDQQLKEETAATVTAIVAMRRAHKLELEKSRHMQHVKENADLMQLQVEHEKEMRLLQKELEVLSDQHAHKCLENSQLYQELQDERQALAECQKENQELKEKQGETETSSQLQLLPNGNQPQGASDTSDFYEMEMILRAREAEMHFLRQEACSLKEELEIARMDKLYAQNKLKALRAKTPEEACHDVDKLCDDSKFAAWSPTRGASEGTATNTSNSAFRRKKSSLTRQIRVVRSKSLKEGLSVQERMKLFESL